MISGLLAVGNGENCPLCQEQGETFIVDKDTDIVKHCLDEHKNDFNTFLINQKG